MKVNFFVEDMLFFKYIGCATAAKSLFKALINRNKITLTWNGLGTDYDIVHFHTFGPLALLHKRLSRGQSILTAHSTPRTNENNLAFSSAINSLYPRIYRSFDHIITISEACQSEIESMLPNTPTTLIPNGVDRDMFRPDREKRDIFRERYGILEDQKLILTVAQQTPRKGIYDMMSLARRFPDFTWIWVGGFPYGILSKEYFRIQRLKKRCGDNIIFTGFVPDITEAYSAADIFFFPSYAETFGLVILEALSSGLPVIARGISELREIFKNDILYYDGWQDVTAILGNDALLEEYAKNARNFTERFDIRQIAQMHETLYQELAT